MSPALNEISAKDGPPLKIAPLAMDVLECLASQAGEVVTIDALMGAVWGDRVVSDNALYNAIAQLRRALDDQRKPHRIIVTVPKRGYQLVAPVEREPATGIASPRTLVRRSQVAVMLLIAAALGFGLFSVVRDTATQSIVNERRSELSGAELAGAHKPEVPEARGQYLIARYFIEQQTSQTLSRASWHLQRALELDPDYLDALVGLCDVYLLQADIGGRSYESALQQCQPILERAGKTEPQSADSLVSRGLLALGHELNDEALAFFEQALRLDSDHVNALKWSGTLLREQGEYDRALARHAHAATFAPGSRSIQRQVGLSLLALGDLHAAQVHLRHGSGAASDDSDSNFGQLDQGYGPLNREHAALALEWAELHQEQLMQYPHALVVMALIRQSLDDADGARQYLEAAQALNPSPSSLHYAWAVVHLNAGRFEQALRSFQQRAAATGNRRGFDLHPIIIRGLLGQPNAALHELAKNYPVVRSPEQVPADHFFILQAYALLQRLVDDPDADNSIAQLRVLLQDCVLCDAMTSAELHALEGDQAKGEAIALQAIADGWLVNHQAVPWGYRCNPFFHLLGRPPQQRDWVCHATDTPN